MDNSRWRTVFMTLTKIVKTLPSFAAAEVSFQEPAIFVAVEVRGVSERGLGTLRHSPTR